MFDVRQCRGAGKLNNTLLMLCWFLVFWRRLWKFTSERVLTLYTARVSTILQSLWQMARRMKDQVILAKNARRERVDKKSTCDEHQEPGGIF